MSLAYLPNLRLNWREDGNPKGQPLIFSHALGLDLTMWDGLVALLPRELRLIRYDHRGHGGSDCPAPPYSMGAMIRDVEQLIDHLGLRDCIFIGSSLGGLVAQGLAAKRADLIRALVLANTAAKIGTPASWQVRCDSVRKGGLGAIADQTIERWFPKPFRQTPDAAHWRARLLACRLDGYIGAASAIAGTDLITPTSGLTLPALVIAGGQDGSTPADLVRELAELIPHSRFALIRNAGHLPAIDRPAEFSALLASFIADLPDP